MDVNSRILAQAEKLERLALDIEAYSDLIRKYIHVLKVDRRLQVDGENFARF